MNNQDIFMDYYEQARCIYELLLIRETHILIIKTQ